jgi:hypothetical protein
MRQWLTATAQRLGIYLGAGRVERDGSDSFNVFVLADPNGEITGRAYKSDADANVFGRGRNEHVIDTALGRIGIGICVDNRSTSCWCISRSWATSSDGSVLAQLDETEDALVATATSATASKPFEEPPTYGRYLQPGSAVVRKVILPIDIAHGRLSYRLSRDRRRTAGAQANA